MKNLKLFAFIVLVSSMFLASCKVVKEVPDDNSGLMMKRTLKSEREKFKEELLQNKIANNFALALNDSTEKNYDDGFWAAELLLDSSDVVKNGIKTSLDDFFNRSAGFQLSVLECAYTIFPTSFSQEVFKIAEGTDNSKLFAIAVNYLTRMNYYPVTYYSNLLFKKFNNWQSDPILISLNQYLLSAASNTVNKRPPLVDLLSFDYGKDKTIIFSFQREDRDYQGLAVIRKPDGKFVRSADGRIFSIPQLARAITNLPSYITNGNTPQGLLSIQGIDTSSNVFIGPTPNIQLIMPFESTPQKFLNDENVKDTIMNMQTYQSLIPDSWKNYFPIYESFYAGKAGRTEIISHGTTTNPEFYLDKPYYPNTPTLGCISSKEIWSEDSGKRMLSDQQALIDAFLSAGSKKGYYVVVNLDNKKQPVIIDEVVMQILQAEKIIRER